MKKYAKLKWKVKEQIKFSQNDESSIQDRYDFCMGTLSCLHQNRYLVFYDETSFNISMKKDI